MITIAERGALNKRLKNPRDELDNLLRKTRQILRTIKQIKGEQGGGSDEQPPAVQGPRVDVEPPSGFQGRQVTAQRHKLVGWAAPQRSGAPQALPVFDIFYRAVFRRQDDLFRSMILLAGDSFRG